MDREWHHCLREAANLQTQWTLHQLFTSILLHCHPTHPEALWTEFCAHICDDLARELIRKGLHQAPTPEEVYDYGLYLIEGLITQAGRAMARVCPSMPTSQIIWSQVIGNPLIAQHTHYNCDLLQQEVHDMLPLLNNEQQIAYDGVVRAFRSGRGGCQGTSETGNISCPSAHGTPMDLRNRRSRGRIPAECLEQKMLYAYATDRKSTRLNSSH